MVEYYDLSKIGSYSESGFIGFIKGLSVVSNYAIGYALLVVFFVLGLLILIRKDKDVNVSLNVASLYTAFLAIVFYSVGIIDNSLGIWIPSVLFVTTVIIRWVHK